MQARETSPGYTGGGGPPRQQLRCDNLQNLPQELLQMVLKDVPRKFLLRSTCKAFSISLANYCDSILLNRAELVSHGPRNAVSSALNAFPNARCVIIDLESRLYDFTRANPVLNVQSNFSSSRVEDPTGSPIPSSHCPIPSSHCPIPSSHCTGSSSSPPFGFLSITSPNSNTSPNKGEEEEVLLQTLSALRGHITSLAIISLSCPPPSPSALNHMRFTLLHLEMSSASYEAALEQGAVNILLRDPQALCVRSDAMIQLAASLPLLRTLSISTAAFSASSVVALTGLSRLELLSLVGCMDCPGGTAQAAETYRRLLLALPALRHLRLPMAVAVTINSASTALLDDEDEDQNEDDSWDSGEGIDAGFDGGGDGGGGDGGLHTHSRVDRGTPGEPVPYVDSGSAGSGSSPHGASVGPKWTTGYESMPGSSSSSNTHARSSHFQSEPALAPVMEMGSQLPVRPLLILSKMKKTLSFPTQTTRDDGGGSGGSRGTALFCTSVMAPAAAAAATPRQRPQRRQRTSQPGFAYSFPAHLRDLTIPLCSLNRPIFEAVCAAYGSDGECDAKGNGAGCSCNGAAAISRSYGPPAASAFDVTRGASNIGSTAMRDTRRGSGGGDSSSNNSLRSLHIATLGGYSQWEGSFLKTTRDFEMLARLRDLTTLHLSIDPGALQVSSPVTQKCFQKLLALRNLTDLRVSEAQPPACFSVRNPLSSRHRPSLYGSFLAAAAAAEDTGAPMSPSPPSLPLLLMPPSSPSPPPPPPPPFLPRLTKATASPRVSELPSAALQLLQRQWPHLTTLQFFSETTVRGRDGQLLVSQGISDVSLLPQPCACCTAPCLMAAKKPLAGRLGRVE
ncbi:hypothetical protein Vafri_9664 [Volvox africanus]|uniref:F-box domain-containing protein n=1 Tax=Volvox africanus TaxID=51714 RepID=A0A8J4B974_9CHLO|nr:hypothetical protein Vafri_9664 [Volvox africanus]